MKRYKLLKDLPNLEKGTILSQSGSALGLKILVTEDGGAVTNFISNEMFEKFFEEIQESTDSIHWKPRIGDRCFILENNNIRHTNYTGMVRDYNAYITGRVFRFEKEAIAATNRELAEVRLRRTSSFEPDLKNGNSGWIVGYDHSNGEFSIECLPFCDYGEIVRYETKEDAQKSIKENREDWLIYFGIDPSDNEKQPETEAEQKGLWWEK